MHPKLHISAGVEYDLEPKRTYGARYHLVATPSVKIGAVSFLEDMDLTKPKSHNFIVQFEFTKILEGFKSRCIMKPVCKYFNAFVI
jgi:hypothetical protein